MKKDIIAAAAMLTAISVSAQDYVSNRPAPENRLFESQAVENEIVNTCLLDIDKTKNVLVSLVKADNIDQYLDRSAKVYYTGKKFPATVALNKLYYFMPYMKSKGIRDLYFIKIARVGTKQEVHPECEDNDFRLVFEIEYVGQLYEDYKPIKLDIWRTFTDTTMSSLQIKVKQGE